MPEQANAPTGQGDGGAGTADSKVLEGLSKLLEKHGQDTNAAVRTLYEENFKLRELNREIKAKAMPDDGIVLQGDDVKSWEAYRALGAPDVLKAATSEREQFRTELDGLKRARMIQSAAKVAGYSDTVLAQLDKLVTGLTYAVKTVEANGRKFDAAFVIVDGKETPIEQYAASNWGDFLPSLQTKQQGTPFVQQRQGNQAPAPLTPEEIRKRKMASGNYAPL